MRKLLLIVGLIFLCASSTSEAQSSTTTQFMSAYAYEDITVSNSAIGFTASNLSSINGPGARAATFSVTCSSTTTCPITFRVDGGTPTAGNGLQADYEFTVTVYNLPNLKNFLAIRTTSTSAVIHVTYFQ
jgi:hypothetical protein